MTPLVVSGSAHPALAAALATAIAAELATCLLGRFPDGEPQVELGASAGGRDVFLVQPLGPPVAERLLELLLLADGCRLAGARSITAIVPYLGLARQDRVQREGQPLGVRALAQALESASLSRVIAVDLHSAAAAACFRAPIVHLTAAPAIARQLSLEPREGSVVVAPDLGAVKLAETYGRLLGAPLAIVHKTRLSGAEVAVQGVLGEVRGKRVVVVDDMISTGGTIAAALNALALRGCLPEAVVAATHGLFSAGASRRLAGPSMRALLTTDSLPPTAGLPAAHQAVALAPLLADVVRRLLTGKPLGELLSTR